jgi:hypothetical protein
MVISAKKDYLLLLIVTNLINHNHDSITASALGVHTLLTTFTQFGFGHYSISHSNDSTL